VASNDNVGWPGAHCTGAVYHAYQGFRFGTAPLTAPAFTPSAPPVNRLCVFGFLLDVDATPARMTVFVDGEPLPVQCEYDFPKDGRVWFPSVALSEANTEMHSCAI
jgi:hypothetical protein